MNRKDNKIYILETAFKLFLDKGYRNTSMSDLVAEAKLSKGAFYYYFKNKETLYQEVISRYFISYYDQVDWNVLQGMSVVEMKMMIEEFYMSFIPEILSVTEKGMSRYFIMFFEAYEEYPLFKEKVRAFYGQLEILFGKQLLKENAKNPILEAREIITKYEGLIFWISVFPEENIEKLLVKG